MKMESAAPATLDKEDILQWAKLHLSQVGTLKEEEGGFVYLKVDDEYIEQLGPMLSDPRYEKPPYFRRSDSPGAHISIFYVNERRQTGTIHEIGQRYNFKIIGLAAVPQKTHEYIVLEVESRELEQLRKKYGLSPLLMGHQFHITIAKKKPRRH
ncbi:MAG: hypothetical protein H0X29_07545 [Parachlamydiaceae bacterium]|nr:hypothetical protein [Parachlamydiaceae bacterium]